MSRLHLLERLMSMDDAAWARHANPWSGWTRLTVLPLLALAVWSRIWLGVWAFIPVILVFLWTWLNPRLFAKPANTNNWMSKLVLGERLWLARANQPIAAHHVNIARWLGAASGVGLLILLYGLWRFDIGFTAAGLILATGAKLWFGDRMVWIYMDEHGHPPEKTGQ